MISSRFFRVFIDGLGGYCGGYCYTENVMVLDSREGIILGV